MPAISVCFVSCSGAAEAEKIGKALVKKRLVACANIVPKISSVYRWNGKVKRSREALLLLKTKKSLHKKIAAEIKKLHSFELPAIEFIEAETTRMAQKWVFGETL